MSSTQKHPAALEHHENVDPDEIRAVEETFGTIVVAKEADARQMLRPQPSLDPNDPLVCQPRSTMPMLMFTLVELAVVAKVLDLQHNLLLHIPIHGEREQFQCRRRATWQVL